MRHLHNHQPSEINLPLKQVIIEGWKIAPEQLPISGGWGYVMEDPIVINNEKDTIRGKGLSEGVSLEYLIVEKRIHAELITLRTNNDIYVDVRRKVIKQELIKAGGRWYDHLRVYVIAFEFNDFMMLSTLWGERESNIQFNNEAYSQKENELQYWYETDYWFDITSFYIGRRK